MQTICLVAALAVGMPTVVWAGTPAAIGHADTLLLALPSARGTARLTVTSPGFADGADLPRDATAGGGSRFPGLAWTPGPAGTRAYLVAVQGVLPGGGTSIHLTLLDVPAGTTTLPAGMAQAPAGARYGLNVHGVSQPYTGPHPHGAARQAYHIEVLALDTVLTGLASPDYATLAMALRGHVLASGELIGYAAGAVDSAASRTPIRIDSGLVAGAGGRDPSVTVYKGIPYAAPPVGALRWRPPAPAVAWAGVRDASRFGPACPQPGGEMARGLPQSEDCLTANVWTAGKPGDRRPVFVWIYGGGFIGGTGASPEFDGEGLARKGIVVVTFNYRVGVLGFLATPALSRESGHHASGNYGLMDDIALLGWVKRNIAAFGGDLAKVTIGGQSAGAGSSGFMTLSPLARGLFRAAILESHARDPGDPDLRFLSTSYRTLADAEAAGTRYVAAHGSTDLAALRAMPWQDLVSGSDTIDAAVDTHTTAKPPLFRPVIDGWVLPRGYAASLAARAQAKVTVIAGNNRDETGGVPDTAIAALRARAEPPRAGMPPVSVTLAQWQAFAHAKFGPMAEEFLRLYPAASDDEAAAANNAAAHDNNRVSTWLWANRWAPGTRRPIYTYWWTHAPPGPGHDQRGAYHGSEIAYAFDSLDAVDRPWTGEDRAIADRLSSYWANFIAASDPNDSGLPAWPAFSPTATQVMQLGDGWGPLPIAADAARIEFWRRYYASQRQW